MMSLLPRSSADCVVIGAGPAGSSFACAVAKHAPSLRVVQLERNKFPRWRIGESTIPVANGVLRDIGVYETLKNSDDYVNKLGVVFIWGQDRKPWNADFLSIRDLDSVVSSNKILDVTGQNFGDIFVHRKSKEPFLAFNCRRDRFDQLLLNQSRALGADVREETIVTEVVMDKTGRVSEVLWENKSGQKGIIETQFVLDGSGLSSLLTKDTRTYFEDMNNFAVFGYFKDAEWKVTYNGTRDASTAFIASIDHGWMWYFPIAQDVMSVGVVTKKEHFKDGLKNLDLEGFFWTGVKQCPEVYGLLEKASLRDDILPDGRKIHACSDWSSWSRSPVGLGWAAAGDAAAFVDPILSSGVTLALQTGHRAAYSFMTLKNDPTLCEEEIWTAYSDYLYGEYSAFLRLARFFYGNNRAAPSWWWEAQRLVNSEGKLDISDKDSFAMAAAGFFPTSRFISPEIIVPMLTGITGSKADFSGLLKTSGLPSDEELIELGYTVEFPLHLALRTEPDIQYENGNGELKTYYDITPRKREFGHRYSAHPHSIDHCLAPIVQQMHLIFTVRDLIDLTTKLLLSEKSPTWAREAAMSLVKVAALKGFLKIHGIKVSVDENKECLAL